MFYINGRTFALRQDDRIINLKLLGIGGNGFCLYDTQNKQYLCPNHDGNVEVKEGCKYVIRRPFPIATTKQEKKEEKHKQHPHHNNKNNPFIKFCQEYRLTHPGEKVKVEAISDQWKQLDEKTKREKYGYNPTTIPNNLKKEKKEDKKNDNCHKDNNNKRKRNEKDDDNDNNNGNHKNEDYQNKTSKRGRPKKDDDTRKLSSKKEGNDHNNTTLKKETNKNIIEEKKQKQHDSFDSLFGTDDDDSD